MAANNITILSDGLRRLSFQFTGSVADLLRSDNKSETDDTPNVGPSGVEIDTDLINQSLDKVNNFSKRRNTDKLPPVLMYEICSTGESSYKNITLRELLNTVNDQANEIDAAAIREVGSKCKIDEAKDEPHAEEHHRPFSNPGDHSPSIPRQTITSDGHRKIVGSKTIYESRYNFSDHHHGQSARTQDHESPSNVPEETYDATGGLRLRDLRRLDFQFNPNEERSVLIRRHAVLFAMVSY